MNKLNQRVNVDRQERVVDILWDFASKVKTSEDTDCTWLKDLNGNDKNIALKITDVTKALGDILATFGYRVQPID